MSEPGGSSEENLRRVREKVMQLAREIEKMSGEEIPPNIFFPRVPDSSRHGHRCSSGRRLDD